MASGLAFLDPFTGASIIGSLKGLFQPQQRHFSAVRKRLDGQGTPLG
jgi:hypothetical protein